MTNNLQILSSWSYGVKLLMEEDNPLTGDEPAVPYEVWAKEEELDEWRQKGHHV